MVKKLLLITCIASCFGAFAQGEKYIAEDLMAEYRYAEAIDYYTKAIKKKETAESLAGLGECYKVLREYSKAERYYRRALAADKKNQEYAFNYGLMLKANGKYPDAIAAFNNYKTIGGRDSVQADIQIEGCEMGQAWLNTSTSAFIMYNEEDVNTRYSDFGMVSLTDKSNHYLYSTNRRKRNTEEQLSSEIQKPYFSILDVELGKDSGQVSIVQSADFAGSYKYHIATPSFTQNQDTVYFTRTDISKKEKEILNRLDIYFAVKDSNGWSEPKPFLYNSKGYSTTHPWISKDGSTLYFISDKPGGLGGFDIYSSKKEGILWGAPINLGETINTPLDEFFPVFQNDKLYFSSNGHAGIGGLDLFSSDKLYGTFTAPENMGLPYNSSQDDFAYIMIPNGEKSEAYFASNREGGKGSDDIYYIEKLSTLPNVKLFTINLTNAGNKVTAYGNELTVLNKEGANAETLSDEYGIYYTQDPEQTYYANIQKDGYFKESIPLNLNTAKPIDTIMLRKGNPIQKGIVYAVDVEIKAVEVGREYTINNIYFDYNSASIRTDAEEELNALAKLLNENVEVSVEIGSHCDARGDDSYNRELSVKRAKSVRKYLLAQGVKESRLTYQGYGESQILNKCKNGVECTEEEHEINRRTTFKIIESK